MTQVAILQVLLRRKRILLLSGIATACVAFVVSRTFPLQYYGEGNLIIESRTTPGDNPAGASPSLLNDVSTQVDVLRSGGLVRQVIHDLNLTAAPGLKPSMRLPEPVLDYLTGMRDRVTELLSFAHRQDDDDALDRLIIYIQKHLKVEAKENSSAILVRYTAGTPTLAAAVANAIMTTYLSTVGAARNATIARTEQWVSQQMTAHIQEVATAERRVTEFVQSHNLAEVQGSLTTAIQLSKDQTQLSLAREELARQQAALNTAKSGSIMGAEETLASKSIQKLKEAETKVIQQMTLLTQGDPRDPRRGPLQAALKSVQMQMANEYGLMIASLSRAVQIANAHVQALELAVQTETTAAQTTSAAGATLRQLTGDLEAKRQIYVSFLTQAGQARLAAEQSPIAHILFRAVPPQLPAHSFGMISLVLGFFCGVTGAAGIAIMRNMMSSKINTTDEMSEVTGLPVFGSLPEFKQSRGRDILAVSPITETFRAMWITLRPRQREGVAILVTSSETGEGKTTVALGLARRFASDGFRVLLIDCDLRSPGLATLLKRQPEPSIETMLNGVVQGTISTVEPGFDCLLADGSIENPVKILSSDRFERLLADYRQVYDFVILDSPPVLHVADPLLLAKLCQHIIFLVQSGCVSNELVSEATQRFTEEDRAKMLTLLTRVRHSHMDGRDYYSGYAAPIAGR